MARFYHELKNFVHTKFPDYPGKISSDIYPPPFIATVFAQLAGYLWIAGIILLVGGSTIFQNLDIPEPEFCKWIANNRMMAFAGLFLLNNVANSFLATGAFEVFLGDELIFSKLAENRFPSAQDILEAFARRGVLPNDQTNFM
jgi:selT/selW/selH-like putative selenoprotein